MQMRGIYKVINYADNNLIKLAGTVVSDKSFSHEIYGEGFYSHLASKKGKNKDLQ